jgi:hypothetical protein
MSKTINMSDEQRDILIDLQNGKNVITDAIAGSGKSTTILSVAQNMPETKVLQMTFNKSLSDEVKVKINDLGLKNINVHTFHGLAKKYYMLSAHTDTSLRYILYNKLQPRIKIPQFQLVVLDESQDMSFLYYQFMVKFLNDMGSPFLLLVLGDFKQGLYEFKGADTRFLILADKIWINHPFLVSREFSHRTLRMSYRITQQMADFVNYTLLGNERMLACKQGEPVSYYRQGHLNAERFVTSQIRQLLQEGAKPSDFFVLGASVKGHKSLIRKMENVLVENGIPCHVRTTDNNNADERIIDGKVVFTTFHCVKGRQRKYVFIMGFDHSYYYSAKTASKDICPNTLYVGCTRATDKLFLLERNDFATDKPLPFLKMDHHLMKKQSYIDFKGYPQTIFYEKIIENTNQKTIPKHNISPSKLIEFIPESVIEEISPLLDKIFVKDEKCMFSENSEIDIPTIIKTRKGFYEDISDLNGIAIPIIYYHHMKDKIRKNGERESNYLLRIIQNTMGDTKENEHKFLKKIINELPEHCTNTNEYLYMANVYVAAQERLYFKLKQIDEDEYNWLSDEMLNECLHRLDYTIGSECSRKIPIFEQTLIDYSMDEEHNLIDAVLKPHFDDMIFRFSARLDVVTETSMWELKCTSKLGIEHQLQVIVYAWLWRILIGKEENPRQIKLFNIKTGEIMRLEATTKQLTKIIVTILKGKYGKLVTKTDDEFINDCHQSICSLK